MTTEPAGRVAFIVNPAAGGARRRRALRQALRQAHALWLQTESRGDAVRQVEAAVRQGAQRIVAVGGDGTVHEVVNALMGLADAERPELGVIPCGSGNDFAWSSAIPKALPQALAVALGDVTRPLDVGTVASAHKRGYWVNTLGVFIIAAINAHAHRAPSALGFARYAVGALRAVAHDFEPAAVRLELDDEVRDLQLIALTVGNGAREGGVFLTNPGARNDDGVLNVMYSLPMSRLSMARMVPSFMRGIQDRAPQVQLRRAVRIRLHAGCAMPVHADGEVWADTKDGISELEIGIVPGALRVAAPAAFQAPPGQA